MSKTVVLEEEYDQNYEPTENGMLIYISLIII